MDWTLWLVAVFSCLLALGYIWMHRRYQQRNRDKIEQIYVAALAARDIEAAEIFRESMNLGRQEDEGIRPSEVHRILHVAPDRWYLYIHIEGSDPLITAISHQRAKKFHCTANKDLLSIQQPSQKLNAEVMRSIRNV